MPDSKNYTYFSPSSAQCRLAFKKRSDVASGYLVILGDWAELMRTRPLPRWASLNFDKVNHLRSPHLVDIKRSVAT